jgi:hypothetical protein
MTTATSLRNLAALAVAAGALTFAGAGEKAGPPAKAPPGPKLSGPYTCGNLTVFLVHGEDRLGGKNFLTLDEALEAKKVVVHETQNVSQLAIDNTSADEVFIQAGDIIKGGQQDRVLAYDLVVPAGAKKVPLSAFCVEAGRWRARGGEEVRSFASSKQQLATSALKGAARDAKSQPAVWKEVENAQAALSRNVMAGVKDARSATSLQLTLENKKVNEAIDAAVKKLAASTEGKGDVVGYVAAINGRVTSADVYGSPALFKKLWPKLLKASAVEAVAEQKKEAKFEPTTAEAAQAFLADAGKGKRSEREVDKRINELRQEGEKAVLFECHDKNCPSAPLRQSYLKK